MYRFEISGDPQFSNPIASGAISEAMGRASFVPNSDLTPGMTYYWRAQALDPERAATSEYTSAVPFSVLQPDTGDYRYLLTLHIPNACALSGGIGPQVFPVPGGRGADIATYDDNLSVTESHIKFSPPSIGVRGGPSRLVLDLERTGSRVTGQIGGTSDRREHLAGCGCTISIAAPPLYVPFPKSSTQSYPTTGTAENTGTFEGTFAGAIYVWDDMNTAALCTGQDIRWSLTPWHP